MRKFFAISLVVGVFATAAYVSPAPAAGNDADVRFAIKPLALLGDPVPNGGEFDFGFEPYAVNNRGDVAFAADLFVAGMEIGQGIFIRTPKGELIEVVRAGEVTPEANAIFGSFVAEKTPMNYRGDLAFAFQREPESDVAGVNTGVYRFSRKTGAVTPVMLPGDPAPGGGKFAGALTASGFNNWGHVAFAGLVTGADIDPDTPPGIDGLGVGVFIQDRKGRTVSVIRPGHPGPAGGVFDFATMPTINDRGDMAFNGHVNLDECVSTAPVSIFCLGSVYFKSRKGRVLSLAHQGDPAPGGGTYRFAFRPVINNRSEVVFLGDLTPAPGLAESVAVFLYSQGKVIPIARPGDVLPGGGVFVTGSPLAGTLGLNWQGDVVFSASLLRDGKAETGLYVFSRGRLHLVAKTGTVIPKVGTIVQLQPPDSVGQLPFTWTGGAVNERRQVVFMATVEDASGGPLRGVLLQADPKWRMSRRPRTTVDKPR